jgi:hypothetical protein
MTGIVDLEIGLLNYKRCVARIVPGFSKGRCA